MARGHYLKRNDKCETIHEAVWFDTETDQVELSPLEKGHVLRQGWAAFSRWRKATGWSDPTWIRFETITEFWDWVEGLTRPKAKLYVFCHNTSFDLPVMDAFHELPARGWKAHKIVAEGPPTIIEMRRRGATLALLDTLNWWRIPLRRLGESLGIPKLDMPAPDAGTEAWDTYNRRDVEIIMVAVQRWCDFLRDNDFGGFAATLAGQALRTYRHRFMHHKILIDSHTNALECSREAYHGGRTEAFHIGPLSGEFHLFDVNSMFPAVMADKFFPSVYAFYAKRPPVADLRAMLRRYLVCARVTVTVDRAALAVVHDGRLVFPTGTFDCALSTPELMWVLEHGAINRVHDMSMYHKAPLFRDYVTEIYRRRLDARDRDNEVEAMLFKLLLNSLYGKFGQRGYVYEHTDDTQELNPAAWSEVDIDTGERHNYRRLLGWIMEQQRESESAGSHPAIAAHVTAYARMQLNDIIERAGRENVYYCDTDSVLTNRAGAARLRGLIHPDKLGFLKLEGTFTDIDIRGAKDYTFGSKSKTKGVRAGAEWLTPNEVVQERWSGLKGLIRSGRVNMPTTARVHKHLSREYKKGTVLPDGRVQPLRFGPR